MSIKRLCKLLGDCRQGATTPQMMKSFKECTIVTWNELAQSIFKNASDEEAGVLLWACTAFPFNTIDGTREQLEKMHERSGGDFGIAMNLAHEDLDRGMEEARKKIEERDCE